MFEQIVLRRSNTGPALTLGELAEALLFYKKVHLVLDYGGINSLIDSLGMEGLLALLKRGNVTATYTEEMLGVNTQTINGLPIHRFIMFKMSGDQTTGELKTHKQRLIYLLTRKGCEKTQATRLAERFLEIVPVRPFSGKYFANEELGQLALADVLDRPYLLEAVQRIAKRTPGFEVLPAAVVFDAKAMDPRGFDVYTNIDFDAANARRKLLGGGLDPITPAHWLATILDARVDMALAAHYSGEFYTSDEASELVRLRYSELLKKGGIASEERRSFTDVVLDDYPSIRDVINVRERTFDEFLSILDKSERFREWAQSVHPDAKLVEEYLREVTAESWVTTMPARVVRYILVSAIGLAHPAVGLAVGAVDSLLLDKIAKGWRPSHFVDGKLKPFLKDDE